MLEALQFVATLCAALFAGAAIYINIAEHPARMRLDTRNAALDTARNLASKETRTLLALWGRLHALRSLFSAIATLLMLWALV